MLAAQIIIIVALIAMISGKVPLYLTAFVGATVAALAAGFPINAAFAPAGYDGPHVIGLVIASGLNPVILDMLGVLLFIGIMEKVGFLNSIILQIIRIGHKLGGGPGVATAGGIGAGIIGGMTGFTQPAITGVVTGPPAVQMGVDKNRVAGILAHAGHLGNLGGFTHPTILAVVAMTGIAWGPTNIVGIIVALSIFAASYIRVRRMMKNEGTLDQKVDLQLETSDVPFGKAIIPFIILIAAFVAGIPVLMVGIGSALIVVLMSIRNFIQGEKGMMEGLGRITVPLFATVAFLFMARVVNEIGLINVLVRSEYVEGVGNVVVGGALYGAMSAGPLALILIMFFVGSFAGLVTQSNGASIPFILPVLMALLAAGVNPVAAAVAAAGGPAIMQYYLTGGPVAALSTVIPVIPGSDLKLANKFQRPSILVGMAVLLIINIFLALVMPHAI
ncbi:MAG: hypothetical protein FWE19_06025 [Oscillospiraceae bacterium]|nr:hypothetical protein [Oscillospiraceae bacterium]